MLMFLRPLCGESDSFPDVAPYRAARRPWPRLFKKIFLDSPFKKESFPPGPAAGRKIKTAPLDGKEGKRESLNRFLFLPDKDSA